MYICQKYLDGLTLNLDGISWPPNVLAATSRDRPQPPHPDPR